MHLNQHELMRLLSYNPDSGIFRWESPPCNRVKKGSVAGHLDSSGYVQIHLKGKQWLAHRLAVLYMTGSFPAEGMEVDHLNSCRTDNSYCNLRVVTKLQNLAAKKYDKPLPGSKSGMVGAWYISSKGKWHSAISINGKRKSLGYFDTALEAHQRYMKEKAGLASDISHYPQAATHQIQ